jgi:hypothetical protein
MKIDTKIETKDAEKVINGLLRFSDVFGSYQSYGFQYNMGENIKNIILRNISEQHPSGQRMADMTDVSVNFVTHQKGFSIEINVSGRLDNNKPKWQTQEFGRRPYEIVGKLMVFVWRGQKIFTWRTVHPPPGYRERVGMVADIVNGSIGEIIDVIKSNLLVYVKKQIKSVSVGTIKTKTGFAITKVVQTPTGPRLAGYLPSGRFGFISKRAVSQYALRRVKKAGGKI